MTNFHVFDLNSFKEIEGLELGVDDCLYIMESFDNSYRVHGIFVSEFAYKRFYKLKNGCFDICEKLFLSAYAPYSFDRTRFGSEIMDMLLERLLTLDDIIYLVDNISESFAELNLLKRYCILRLKDIFDFEYSHET